MFEGTKIRIYLIVKYFLLALLVGLIQGIIIDLFEVLVTRTKFFGFSFACILSVIIFLVLNIFIIFKKNEINISSKFLCVFVSYLYTAAVVMFSYPIWYDLFIDGYVKNTSETVNGGIKYLTDCEVFYVTFLPISLVSMVIYLLVKSIVKLVKASKERNASLEDAKSDGGASKVKDGTTNGNAGNMGSKAGNEAEINAGNNATDGVVKQGVKGSTNNVGDSAVKQGVKGSTNNAGDSAVKQGAKGDTNNAGNRNSGNRKKSGTKKKHKKKK